jgi:hypothetical protein
MNRLSLAFIGLAFSLPFLGSDFRPPIGSFYNEVIAFACWLAAMTFSWMGKP